MTVNEDLRTKSVFQNNLIQTSHNTCQKKSFTCCARFPLNTKPRYLISLLCSAVILLLSPPSDTCHLLGRQHCWSGARGQTCQGTLPTSPGAGRWCVSGRVSPVRGVVRSKCCLRNVSNLPGFLPPHPHLSFIFFFPCDPERSMLLLNYLARKGAESGMVAGLTISVPWDALKSSESMEEPLNWLLFNKYLTNGLCRAVSR